MPISTSCPTCGARLTVPRSAALSDVTCPHCQAVFTFKHTPKPPPVAELIDGDPPRRRKAPKPRDEADDYDDYDDPPRRRYRDDRDPPSRPAPSPFEWGCGLSLGVWFALGGIMLIGGIVLLVIFIACCGGLAAVGGAG